MKLDFLQCAEMVLIDQLTNKLSLIHVVDNVVSASFPFLFRSFYIVSAFTKSPEDPEEPKGEIILALDDVEIIRIASDLNFQGHHHTRNMAGIEGIIIQQPGLLKVTLKMEQEELGHWETPISAQPAAI